MRNTLALLVLTVFVSCEYLSLENSNPSEKHQRMVSLYFKYFNEHDWEKMADMYTENAVFKDPSSLMKEVTQNKKQIIQKYTDLNSLFPDIHDEVIAIYSSGKNHVVVEFVSSGTAPDNTTFSLPICTVFTIKGDKITHDFSYYNDF